MWKHSSLAFTCKATNWQPTPSVLLMCSEALCKLVNINIEFYILFSQFEIHACYCLQHSILTVKTNPGHIPSMKLPFFFFFFSGICIFMFFILLATQCSMWNFHGQGLNPQPLQWKHRVLSTGSPGKSHETIFDELLDLLFIPKWATAGNWP